jgi:hypothetical protein
MSVQHAELPQHGEQARPIRGKRLALATDAISAKTITVLAIYDEVQNAT